MTTSIIIQDNALQRLLVNESQSVLEILTCIEKGGYRIAIVIDENKKFLGIITDYDIRRGILKNKSIDFHASGVINYSPIISNDSSSLSSQISTLEDNNIEHLPLINDSNEVVGLRIISSGFNIDQSNTVVIMAGGLGTRLYPLTKKTPKPMIKVGDMPILETIIDRFKSQGFKNFVISVNYLSDIITNYFGDGSSREINIHYIYEQKKRGTIGALSELLKIPSIQYPILLTNGDIICTTKYKNILDFHTSNNFDATVCAKEHTVDIPYGVIEIENLNLIKVTEKPKLTMSINSGIYALNKCAIELIPSDAVYDATTLIEELLNLKNKVGVHQIKDPWIDIGTKEDLNRLQEFFNA
jgi:dTDP-glucose pyrophosphorylase